MVVVLIVGLLSMRAYNLGQPTSMYFDEVYHARSATEFLQDWNYHLPHDIYEWTHPPLAKYAIAAGIALFADDKVNASANLGVPVRAAVVQERTAQSPGANVANTNAPIDYGADFGERVLVATGSQVRVYDLTSRGLTHIYDLPGVQALSAPDAAGLVYAGTADGKIFVLDTKTLDALRAGQATTVPPPVQLNLNAGFAITHLFAGAAPYLLASDGAGDVISIDLRVSGGALVGHGSVPGAADFASPGPGLLGTTTNPQVLVAYQDGVGLLDVRGLTVLSTVATAAPATSLALNPDAISTNIYRYYVTAGNSLLLMSFNKSKLPATLTLESIQPLKVMPGPVSAVIFDEGTKIAQVLGQTQNGTWTVYAVEANGNAVFSDARLSFKPVILGLDNAVTVAGIDTVAQMPGANREALLAFGPNGDMASVDVGQFAFSWRIMGVLFGVLMAVCLYLLARLLFRRRSVGVLVALFCALDGMAFVQSRIAMNDTYVAGFLVLAYLIFAALWLRVWQHRLAFALGMPALGTVLGLALVSKWVALYAIASIGILILIRSALGRVLVVLGLIAGTGVLGWQALAEMSYAPSTGNVPLSVALIAAACALAIATTIVVIRTTLVPDKVFLGILGAIGAGILAAGAIWVSPAPLNNGSPDYTFFLIMLAITAGAAATAAARPIAWTAQELHFAMFAPPLFALAAPWLLVLAALPIGLPMDAATTLRYSLLAGAGGLALGIGAGVTFWLAGRVGFGPLAPASSSAQSEILPPDPAPEGWLRLGSGFGLPAAWMAFCLALLPFLVYVALYIPVAMPWQAQTAATGPLPAIACWHLNPTTGTCDVAWPAGHTGQNLWDLTGAMYTYHNDLRDAHPAASPWWAWPLDLKPVWFAGGSGVPAASSAIYDAGNPVLWWLAIAGMAFVSFQAFRRRHLGLTLIAVAFFWQWLSWARIDREAFGYHFYTALPFFLLALAYFLAELWHGPSPRTWAAARVAGAVAALIPAFLWLTEPALCGLVRVNTGNYYGDLVCGTGLHRVSFEAKTLLIGGVLIVALVGLILILRHLENRLADGKQDRYWLIWLLSPLALAGVLIGALGFAGPQTELAVGLPPLMPTCFWLFAGAILAYLSLSARSPRRFLAGVLIMAALAFAGLYAYLSGAWLPNPFGNFYALLSPTWQYGFQFATVMQKGVAVKLLGSGSASAIFLAASVAGVAAMVSLAHRADRRRRALAQSQTPDPLEPEAQDRTDN